MLQDCIITKQKLEEIQILYFYNATLANHNMTAECPLMSFCPDNDLCQTEDSEGALSWAGNSRSRSWDSDKLGCYLDMHTCVRNKAGTGLARESKEVVIQA